MPAHVDAIVDFSPRTSTTTAGVAIECEVLALFDRCSASLHRYVGSFGLGPEATEDIVQDTFLLLFRHLLLGRSRRNLRAWLFQVAHNRALKHKGRTRWWAVRSCGDDQAATQCIDPAPDPEALLAEQQRRQHLRAVVSALPERDRRCLSLRAEGLRYRDIAAVVGMSLGAVAKSLARSMTKLESADER